MTLPQPIHDALLVVAVVLAVAAIFNARAIFALSILAFAGLVVRIRGRRLVAPLHQHGRDGK